MGAISKILRNSDSLQGGALRSRLIIGLMVLILALVLGMAWQANRSVQAHNATAISVLQDYARLAADEYSRRAMGAVGYYGYYSVMNKLRTAGTQDPEEFVSKLGQDDSSAESPSLYVFAVTTEDSRLFVSSADQPPAVVQTHLLKGLGGLMKDPLPDTGFVINHVQIDGEQHTFVVSWPEDTSLIFGIEVDQQWLAGVLQQTFEDNVLLPKSLAGGAMTNDFLFVEMRDSADRILFAAGADNFDDTRIRRELQDEYGGVFLGHSVTVAIDPGLAQSLIIGGLPKSRLPVFVAIILLATGLLVAAIRQLQRENAVMQMRTNFVAEVSHELRTPLTQIRMFTESLLFERFSSADDKQRALSIINRESQRLIHMVENILRFSEDSNSHAELLLEEQDLGTLIASVVSEFQVLADASGAVIEAKLEPGVIARVDGDAMRQVLLNLLDNAIKYGPQGQTVIVELSKDTDKACIAVSDEGPGVPVSERERIWGGYYRLDRERDSAIAGTGIGLAVVGDLLGKHNASVRVEDGEYGGARFVIELPL
jgi:signal transduction histidine kinase